LCEVNIIFICQEAPRAKFWLLVTCFALGIGSVCKSYGGSCLMVNVAVRRVYLGF
jgi:hypothetical protein